MNTDVSIYCCMMVKFIFKQISYGKDKLEVYFRDRVIFLFRVLPKLKEFNSYEKQLDCVKLILDKAIEQKFTKRQLRYVEHHFQKFEFLPFEYSPRNTENSHTYTSYDSIHSISYDLISLCASGYKRLSNLVDFRTIRDEDGNLLEYELSRELSYVILSNPLYQTALAEEVAVFARRKLRIIMQELNAYHRVLSVDEVDIYSIMDDILSSVEYPDNDFEVDD